MTNRQKGIFVSEVIKANPNATAEAIKAHVEKIGKGHRLPGELRQGDSVSIQFVRKMQKQATKV